MSITMKRLNHTIILMLVLVVGLLFVFISSEAGQKQPSLEKAFNPMRMKWYEFNDISNFFVGIDEAYYSITSVCDKKHGNLIYNNCTTFFHET